MTFFDDFSSYPDGNLVGRGLWVAASGVEASPLVASHQVIGVLGTDRQASINLAAMNLDLSRPWSFGFTIRFDGSAPGPADDTYIYLLIGDELGAQNALEVEINGLSGGANHVLIILLDDQGNNFEVVTPFAFGMAHQLTITWDGTIHRAFLDGVQVVSGLLRNPATITLHATGVNIGDFVTGMHWTMESFQFQGKIPA